MGVCGRRHTYILLDVVFIAKQLYTHAKRVQLCTCRVRRAPVDLCEVDSPPVRRAEGPDPCEGDSS